MGKKNFYLPLFSNCRKGAVSSFRFLQENPCNVCRPTGQLHFLKQIIFRNKFYDKMKTSYPFDYLEIKFYLEQEMQSEGLSNGTIYTVLNIGRFPLVDFPKYAIDLQELSDSAKKSGEYFILTCECGIPEDKGIFRGIEVIHFEEHIQWHVYEPQPQRIFNFIKKPYTEEIERAASTFTHIFQKYKQEINDETIKTIPVHDHIQEYYKFLKQTKRKG